MDKKEFIESGILESYVMGLASPQERMDVERMATQYPEVREELTAIEKSLETYSFSNQLTPKAGTKEKIFAAIDKENTAVMAPKITPIRKEVTKPGNAFNWFSIAASIVLFFSIGLNLYLVSKLASVREDLAAIRQQKDAFASEMKTQQASYSQLNDEMGMLMDTSTRKVMMHGVPGKDAKNMAIVYWDTKHQDVMLNVVALPAPPPDMQYQLWAIVDGKPVDEGVFDMSSNAMMLKMKSVSGAVAFAVTLEKHGGSPVPTMSQMFVMGKV